MAFSTLEAMQTGPAGAVNVVISRDTRADNSSTNLAQAKAGTAELRYTINGKDPARTASYSVVLGSKVGNVYYSAPINFTNNYSGFGGDNTVIKARVYWNGQWSNVTTVVVNLVDETEITQVRPAGVNPHI